MLVFIIIALGIVICTAFIALAIKLFGKSS